ncbi:hypothetical protein M758_3G257500 [Ceratodon purpureus]|nr:hypothetical protein M758_3G257500 [Ceratodon purpureus]
MAQFVSRISGLFNPKSTQDHAKATQRYLELTKKCMVEALKMTLESSVSHSPKFNYEQCRYLADKLKGAVESADSFLELLNSGHFCFPSSEETANCLEIFKQLFTLAMGVENFIQSCCKDAWIEAVVTLRNVSEHVSSVGFNLMLWTVVFSEIKQVRAKWTLTATRVNDIFKGEVESVKEKALLDKDVLLRKLNATLQTKISTTTEHQLAVQILLLERIEQSKKDPLGDSPRPSLSRLSEVSSWSVKRMERLGTGSAGFVYRAKWLETEVAQKTFYGHSMVPSFETEVRNLDGLSHPNIVSLICCAKNERACSIVMELMDEDLCSFIRRRWQSNKTQEFPFGIMEAVDIMHQIGEGMRYLHEMRIVHRDLKAANILVKCVRSSELEIEYVMAKVADFGISRMKEKSTTFSNQTLNIGTTRWMAPEVIKSCIGESEAEKSDGEELVMKYPFKCDIYSFAMVCFEILTGDLPFQTSNLYDVKKMVLDGIRPSLPDGCPSLLKHLIERCWSPDAGQRPRFSEICTELCYMKCLFLSPSRTWNVSPGINKSQSIPRNPLHFKREAHVHWIVGLDIGTTYSGFAYAKGSHLQQMRVNVNYDYPHAESKPYCKALTALFYNQQTVPSKPQLTLRRGPKSPALKCAAWGQAAQLNYLANVHRSQPGQFYVPNFKLLLPRALNNHPLEALPPPLTVASILTDYMKHIGELALTQIKNRELREGSFGSYSVAWSIAVPSTWNPVEKGRMRVSMMDAGLLTARPGENSSVRLVRKAKAASFYCSLQQPLQVKDKLMVVDIGGWTVDIIVQEVVRSGNDFKVKELTESSSGLCGGTFVDESFIRYLFEMVKCLEWYLCRDDPYYRLRLLNRWEEIKCSFGHEVNSSSDSFVISLPENLAQKWEAYERKHGYLQRYSYSKIKLTQEDLESIFEPVVDNILRLISAQLVQVPGINAMFVVGGFAGSPYLIHRIRSHFSREIQHIFCPSDPGSAIMQGAIALVLPSDGLMVA